MRYPISKKNVFEKISSPPFLVNAGGVRGELAECDLDNLTGEDTVHVAHLMHFRTGTMRPGAPEETLYYYR